MNNMNDKNDNAKVALYGASRYMADKDGNIYGINGRKLSPVSNGWAGYWQVSINHDDGTTRHRTVHRLVWEAYYGAIPDGMEVSHLDDDKSNNALDNLALMTHHQNCMHGARNERISQSLKAKRGLKKIYAEQVAARRAAKNGKGDK